METLDNSQLDRAVALLNHDFTEKILTHEKLNPLKIASLLLRPWVSLKQKTTRRQVKR
ncbi:hypothetical protein DSOL_3814 [Desulfosporosinus metallidurans]|uniref:Uncharacterized protein n=1 Tax=Desulfosporosinus metallidurans TaxID=1888891 RepID=A0A1Q8QNF5_9FIRM|nr:hypothetical protein DSOL_3814 [Desulfosporosinus metallidurans]